MRFDQLSRLISARQPRLAPPDGARLSRCGERAWVADRELVYAERYRLPLRMVVLQDDQGMLDLYSPVALDEGTIEALAGIGEVCRIIVPNRFHTLFVEQALAAFPAAALLLPPSDGGLARRFPQRARHVTELIAIGADLSVLPVNLRRDLDELVVYHDPAELLVVSDLLFNFQHGSGLVRALLTLNGVWRRPAHSRLQRWLLLRNRAELARFYRWAMSKPFSQISMSHGQLLTTDAREVFYQLFGRFG